MYHDGTPELLSRPLFDENAAVLAQVICRVPLDEVSVALNQIDLSEDRMVWRTESVFDGSRVGAEGLAEPIDGHRIESTGIVGSPSIPP